MDNLHSSWQVIDWSAWRMAKEGAQGGQADDRVCWNQAHCEYKKNMNSDWQLAHEMQLTLSRHD